MKDFEEGQPFKHNIQQTVLIDRACYAYSRGLALPKMKSKSGKGGENYVYDVIQRSRSRINSPSLFLLLNEPFVERTDDRTDDWT